MALSGSPTHRCIDYSVRMMPSSWKKRCFTKSDALWTFEILISVGSTAESLRFQMQ